MTKAAEKTSEPSYDFWKRSLAGEKPKMFVDDAQLGFYRKPIKERNDKGNNKRVGWSAVAIYMQDGVMTARVTSKMHITSGNTIYDAAGDELNELWSYVAGHPISESEYRQVAEEGMNWSDATDEVAVIPAANRDVAKSDNAPSEEVAPVQAHTDAITNAINSSKATIKTVASNEDAAVALGTKNRIAELRLACDKAGRAEYEPMHANYVKVRDPWQKPVKSADAEEKRLNGEILRWRESERQRIAKEQAEAERKQREIDEANARAADRAIARGEPEPMPEVEEVAMPIAIAPIIPTYGTRTVKEQVKKFAIIHDPVAAFAYFKTDYDLLERLDKLCTDAVRAGTNVPGVSYREGLL
jgi:hypothetical protein